jgi:hypothetical protein
MGPDVWLAWLGLGALLGAAGQLLRTIPGMKKLTQRTAGTPGLFAREFSWKRMGYSLALGAIAGILAALSSEAKSDHIGRGDLMPLLAAGYAGSDFIEAFLRKS